MLTTDNCIDELERVIRAALRQCMPTYIVISEANGNMPVLGSAISGAAITAIKRQRSVPQELEAAMAAILSRLSAAHNPVAVVTHLVSLLGVRDLALDVIRQANLPTAGTPT